MADLTEIYPCVKSICYKDELGVYLDSEKVALSNSENNGYIRWDGDRTIVKLGIDLFSITKPLVFVGAIPGGNPINMIRATVAALAGGTVRIREATIDKGAIAEREGIERGQLTKFCGVGMVWIRYDVVTTEAFCTPAVVAPVLSGIFDDTFDATFN